MTQAVDLTGVDWHKSSYSSGGGQCIEFAPAFAATHGVVPVRDSKDPEGPQLHFSTEAWAAFAAATANGEFGAV
ncbi:DUF397 domain-containing protein [Kitasatospora sp. GP82]|uniref:DUF397 domain-containing protein n=1 Tax=Kitasatospora sp. GP82 TaxID=3035089 RepID=UPI002474D0C1|nr:DUF397 domain-containing protein [Kitasatospora sp. GP82]MDH6124787.1 hypothetical protein [Kitasatospora sp. GP82]